MQHLTQTRDAPGAIPARTGVGLRAPHYEAVLGTRPRVGFLEVHSENFFGDGGHALDVLAQVRRDYPLSLHGVGLSLGSVDPLADDHLRQLQALCYRAEPFIVSDHLTWSSVDGQFFNDLLPLPYTTEALDHVSARIRQVQDRLGRQFAIENPSSYLEYAHSTIAEPDFLRELVLRTGCALLLDVNNVYVSAINHGFDPYHYLDAVPAGHVAEIHLAGHTRREIDGLPFLIDTHDQPVADAVWDLYNYAIRRLGPVPTLIEWDSALPRLPTLVHEARRADCLQENLYDLAA